jgi:hypothetical protein
MIAPPDYPKSKNITAPTARKVIVLSVYVGINVGGRDENP